MARPDLEDWADRYFLSGGGFAKRRTFGCPSYYAGRRMFAFLYEDALGIKCDPALVSAKVSEDADRYRHFNPGDGVMRNWLLIVRPEADEYEEELPLIESAMESFGAL